MPTVSLLGLFEQRLRPGGLGQMRYPAYRKRMTLTIFGVVVLAFMMFMYALERKGPGFILAFALGCGLSSAYGFLSGAWPFGCVEAIWTVIAVHRYWGT